MTGHQTGKIEFPACIDIFVIRSQNMDLTGDAVGSFRMKNIKFATVIPVEVHGGRRNKVTEDTHAPDEKLIAVLLQKLDLKRKRETGIRPGLPIPCI
ncbi:hypothetical protein GQ464_005870 [Rhodocaloribacter litoris]|uniref:hypothetical protein n=1 Tax=Rhodocaloribacter litoris TaxID=2558931 RepID=UPI001E62AE29|nr:hypothetical protein [Rhodocaloribacter litoris]QXD16475.1 hypothetical protein GQ464_005870 [Rhodocaloribacter litoris]